MQFNFNFYIKSLNNACDELHMVAQDLADARDGDILLDDVNGAYLTAAARRITALQDAIKEALEVSA